MRFFVEFRLYVDPQLMTSFIAFYAFFLILIDYILGQWDKYLNFKPFEVQETGDLFPEVMIRQIKSPVEKGLIPEG